MVLFTLANCTMIANIAVIDIEALLVSFAAFWKNANHAINTNIKLGKKHCMM